jgi:hypothetical protein
VVARTRRSVAGSSLFVPALVAALHLDGSLVLHRRSFGGKVPGRVGPIAEAVGVTIHVVEDS